MKEFDTIVLTAANEAQAEGYRAQLAWRKANGLLSPETETLVMTDPGGRRVGSFGATLNVLAELVKGGKAVERVFWGRRILICHSGGDSRRTPAYAAQGKVFTPVPVTDDRGEPLALFDLILRTVSNLPSPENGQVLVTSGDVLLTFDQASTDLSKPGVTGVGYFGPMEQGSRHGVYVPSEFEKDLGRTSCVPVVDFLQKPSPEEAEGAGAVDPFGHVAVDTGLLSWDPQTTALLLELAGVNGKGEIEKGLLQEIIDGISPALDIYEEFTMALVPRFSEERYLKRFVEDRKWDASHQWRMKKIYRALHELPFFVNLVPYCEFFHIGSSRELLNGFSGLSRTAQTYGFKNLSGAYTAPNCTVDGGAFLFNSYVAVPVASKTALVESIHLPGGCGVTLAGSNILTGLPPEAGAVAIDLPENTGLVCLPIGERDWAAVVYGLEDDFKTPFGGERVCKFLNAPIEEWMGRLNVSAGTLWEGDERDGLWRARIWRVGMLKDVLADVNTILKTGALEGGRRFGMAELIPMVNHQRLLAVRQEIRRQVNLARVADRLLADNRLSAECVCGEIQTPEEARLVLKQLTVLLESAGERGALFRARILRLMARIEGDAERSAGYQRGAFEEIAGAVARKFVLPTAPCPAAILHDQVVWVTTPVRIDFSGGWSDTPPICTELGGTVLNAAVKLNGLYPVQVMAKLNTRGYIRLSSIDLGEAVEFTSAEEIQAHDDPHDWAALAKAALILAGIAPSKRGEKLEDWLKVLGGGLDLTIFSSLPKGSGMGTSSILGAAVLACLDRVLGRPFNADQLIQRVSVLEQRMHTGGGWQDQIGGMLPGVKLIRTEPGADQIASFRWSVFDLSKGSDLKERCLLYFTGQKRMARNILQNVVNGYLDRDPVILQTVDELKTGALETKEALDAQDIHGFARGVAKYWELKKRIDPGSTNPAIEGLLALVREETEATLLPGAGGGGFIFLIAKSAEAAECIREKFTANPPNGQARFFDFDIDQKGLTVTVL